MIKIKKVKVIPWVMVLLWMGLIFSLSHQPATESSSLSSGIAQMIFNTIEKFIPNLNVDWEAFHYFIRKNAHFLIYLILGVLVANGLRTTDNQKLTTYQTVVLALVICILYAVSDEVHQIFIPGRAGQVRDVLIDSSGATVGVLLYQSMIRIRKNALK